MRTTRNKKSPSTKARASTAKQKARDAVSRLPRGQARKLPKPRTGFDKLVEPLAAIVEQFGDELGGGLDVEGMRASLKAYQDREPEWRAAVDHLDGVESARLVDSSDVWTRILVIYDRCRSVGRTNEKLLGAIEPIEDFMKTGPHKPHTTATPPVATTTSTS